MTLRAISQWLSRQLMSAAIRVSPCERKEWAKAMSREVQEIPSEREALWWSLGCLQASCRERLKSMKPANWWPVRWAMALWIALLAVEVLFSAGISLTYKLGFFTEHFPYPRNVPLLEVTPLWEPMLALVSGVVFLLAIVLILKRSRGAFGAVVAPFAITLLLFAVRFSRPESGDLQSLSIAYQKSHYVLVWPILGLAMTILICLALWQDRQRSVAR
jgi:hypothetical protein